MNLLFVSNGSLTPVYSAVAKYLESRGHNIFWLVTENIWQEYLLKDFNHSSILHLKRSGIDNVSRIPNVVIPLNEIIYIDRELRTWRSKESKFYIQNLHHRLKNFLVGNDMNFAFSENTWAHEITISMMCDMDNEVGCLHLSPHNLRIPDNRFAFFSNFLLYDPIAHNQPFEDIQVGCLSKNAQIQAQDDVIVSRRNSKAHWLRKFGLFLSRPDYDADSPTWWGTSRYNSLRRGLSQLVKAFTYKFVEKLDAQGVATLARKHDLYVYAFHKEPETAINNKGRYNESQATCILNIWRKLPLGSMLLIKEHRVSVGDRGYFYFQKLLNLGSIRVIEEFVDSAFIREKSSACFTVSGTMAYEYAINQKPAFTFARVFFNNLEYCSHLSIDELTKGDDMTAIIKRLILNKRGLNNKEFVEQLSCRSFSGTIGDTNNLPEVMEATNISLLCRAFAKVVERS